jgi:ribose transport system substrate-binding protein
VTARLPAAIALIAALGMLVSACGGGDSSTSAEAGAGEEGKPAKEVVPAPPTSPPTEIPPSDPIKQQPPAKQDVIWLACALPSCQGNLSKGYKNAAAALGFGFEEINYNTLKAAEGVQNALTKNPDSIFITGIEPSYFEAQWDEAVSKEIPIFDGSVIEEPDPETNGVYMNYPTPFGYGLQGKQIADWMINDSGGKANIAIVLIPEYPILKAEQEAIEGEFDKCPECSVGEIPVGVEELEQGKIPAKVVAYLQQHPDVEYVEFTFSDLLTGVEAAISAAGIDSVKFTGVQADPTIAKQIVDGSIAAWTAMPQEMRGWVSMDAAIRVAAGEPLTEYEKKGELPSWVIDSAPEAEKVLDEGGEWRGPAGFEAAFKKLWGV